MISSGRLMRARRHAVLPMSLWGAIKRWFGREKRPFPRLIRGEDCMTHPDPNMDYYLLPQLGIIAIPKSPSLEQKQ